MLALFPGGTRVAAGVLELDGLRVTELAERFGTPLVVYCRGRRCASGRGCSGAPSPDALVVYGTKAFPNVALMRLLAEEGLGADVSTLGELAFAQRAGIDGRAAVVHGNNKSDEELARGRRGRRARRPRRARRARARGRRRRAPRPRPRHAGRRGRDARGDPHRAPRLEVRARRGRRARGGRAARAAGLDVEGLHVHVGSQLADVRAHLRGGRRCSPSSPTAAATSSAGRRRSSTSAAASGSATSQDEPEPPVEELVRAVAARSSASGRRAGSPRRG